MIQTKGMRSVIGCGKKQSLHLPAGVHLTDFANDLNQFYARFDVRDFNDELNTTITILKDKCKWHS